MASKKAKAKKRKAPAKRQTTMEPKAMIGGAQDETKENRSLAIEIAKDDDSSPLKNLPFEIRCEIYELVLSFPKSIKMVRINQMSMRAARDARIRPWVPVSLGIMFTCRQIYEESRPFFFKLNMFTTTFHAPLLLKTERKSYSDFIENVRKIEWTWDEPDDGAFFNSLSIFPNLEELHLRLYATSKNGKPDMIDTIPWRSMENLLCQHEVGPVSRFCKAGGFDELVQIRGLKSVKVSIKSMSSIYYPIYHPTRLEDFPALVADFEKFLNSILTLPKTFSATSITASAISSD